MERLTTINSVRFRLREARAAGQVIGLVPTMGALHEGHLTLIRQAQAECGLAVVSVFVNPTQFNDAADLEAYPRDLERDAALAAAAGAHLIFAPEVGEIFPSGFQTHVTVAHVTEPLEGKHRPGHFQGVTTVVAKLLNIVQPDRAYFGEKDWQQLKAIERMALDLNLPTTIVAVPTVRESDGLAMSSRNARLSPEARRQARIIPYLLETAQELLDSAGRENPTDQAAVLRQWLVSLLESAQPEAAVDYIAIVDPETLTDLYVITDRALVAVALHIGGVRLIDNRVIVRH